MAYSSSQQIFIAYLPVLAMGGDSKHRYSNFWLACAPLSEEELPRAYLKYII